MSFIAELRRRNVIRVGIAYLAGAWLLIQIVETLFPVFNLPGSAIRIVVISVAVGFAPALILAWVFEITPDGFTRDKGGASIDNKRFDRIIMILMALALAYFSADKFLLDPARDTAREADIERQIRSNVLTESFADRSIVVLPFVNMSSDADNEYFADGITEELLNVLAKLETLRVISRTSTFAFKGQAINIADVVEQLNVTYVLGGSVRKAGDSLRITAQLIDGRSDTHIWSETYDRKLDDIFAIQDEIAAHVAEELKLRILDRRSDKIDPLAYAAMLQARYLLNLYDASRMDEAGELLETGLNLEPDYAALWIEKTRYHTHQIYYGVVPEDEARNEREAAKLHLARVDPESPAVLIGKAGSEENLATRAELVARAYRLAPTDPVIVEAVARLARDLGQFDVAKALGEYLVARDPLCGRCFYRLGQTYMEAFEPESAIPHFEKALLLGAGQLDAAYAIGQAYLMSGDPDTALKMFEVALHATHRQLGLLMAFHDQGRQDQFNGLFAEFEQQSEWDNLALVYAWIGDADKAFGLLEKGHKQFPSEYTTIFSDTRLMRIHDDPRWRALMEKIGTTPEQLAAIKLDISVPN